MIGYGSIGQRHKRILEELGCDVTVVSRRPLDGVQSAATFGEAVSRAMPDYVVVANETSAHGKTVEALLEMGFANRLLVEKPLGAMPAAAFAARFRVAAVGYNLRFHPVVRALGGAVAGQKLVSAHAYCGQYLPDWRPGTDFRLSYSADPARGGGVLRDLSHELDYLLWLFGPWHRVAATGGRLGTLDIASDDCWAILLELEHCPAVSLQLNYLDRPGRRHIIVNTTTHTYCADLVEGTLMRDGEAQAFAVQRDDTYRAQHLAILRGETDRLCTLAQGRRVMQLIEAIERAALDKAWVCA
ncbi:MAG: Gfo/Idh/MocA family protein [Pseudorhodoplanes sp.]